MKLLVALALFAFAAARPDGEYYDLKYENFDVDNMTSNDRLLKSYTLCFIGDGKCTAEGADFKKWIPEAMETSCGKCTEKQKVLIAKALKAIKEKLPEEYVQLKKVHDSEGKYAKSLEEFIVKHTA